MAPTVKRGIITTVTDTTNIKFDISEAIDMLDPFEVPFLDMVGRDSLSNPCTQVKHEWLTDQLNPRAGTLLNAYVAGSGLMTLASGEGKYLVPDDTILVGNVVFRILSGPPDVDVCTVVVIAGTDVAAVAATAWRKVAHASMEGGVARADMEKTVLGRPYNYTQILKDWIIVTGTMEVIDRYGYASERSYQEEKKIKELALDLENALLYGVLSYDAGPPRRSTMGGLLQYVLLDGVTNSRSNLLNAASGVFDENMLGNALQAMWDVGGKPDYIMVNGTNKRRMTAWITPRIRTERTERTAGASVGSYESDFGTIDIVMNRNLRAADVIIGTKGSIGIGPLQGRAFSSRQLPSTLDGSWFEVLGEYTMEVHKPYVDFYWIYNTKTTY
jgi:hypothetical protein